MSDVRFSGRHYSIAYHDVTRAIGDARAIGLYYILLTYVDVDKTAHPSLSRLARDMGLSGASTKQVRSSLEILENLGLVTTFNRFRNAEGDVSETRTEEFNVPISNGYILRDKVVRNDGSDVCENTPGGRGENATTLGVKTPGGRGENTLRGRGENATTLGVKTPGGRGENTLRGRGENATTLGVKTPYKELPNKELPNIRNITPYSPPDPSGDLVQVSQGDPQAGTPTKKPTKKQLDEEFEFFWARVEKKRAKQQARKSFEKQRRTHSLDFICSQLERAQAEWRRTGRDPQYWPHPSTWLNSQLEDDYEIVQESPAQQSRVGGYQAAAERLKAKIAEGGHQWAVE